MPKMSFNAAWADTVSRSCPLSHRARLRMVPNDDELEQLEHRLVGGLQFAGIIEDGGNLYVCIAARDYSALLLGGLESIAALAAEAVGLESYGVAPFGAAYAMDEKMQLVTDRRQIMANGPELRFCRLFRIRLPAQPSFTEAPRTSGLFGM